MTSNLAYPGTESNGDTLTTTNFDQLPGGWIGYVEITSSSGLTGITTTTAITGLSQVVTVNTSRRIKITAGVCYTQNTSAGRVKVYLVEGATTLRTIGNNTQAASDEMAITGSVILTPSSGSHTYSVNISTTAGTVDVNATSNDPGPCWLLVEDIGPA